MGSHSRTIEKSRKADKGEPLPYCSKEIPILFSFVSYSYESYQPIVIVKDFMTRDMYISKAAMTTTFLLLLEYKLVHAIQILDGKIQNLYRMH